MNQDGTFYRETSHYTRSTYAIKIATAWHFINHIIITDHCKFTYSLNGVNLQCYVDHNFHRNQLRNVHLITTQTLIKLIISMASSFFASKSHEKSAFLKERRAYGTKISHRDFRFYFNGGQWSDDTPASHLYVFMVCRRKSHRILPHRNFWNSNLHGDRSKWEKGVSGYKGLQLGIFLKNFIKFLLVFKLK